MTRDLNSLAAEDGAILIEFALICTFFIFLFVGIVDYGIFIHHEIELTDASAIGAHIGSFALQQQNTGAMTALGQASTRDIQNANIAATYFYTCTPGGTQVASSTICNGSADFHPLMYVQVTSTATVPAALKWIGISNNLALQGQATYRAAWVP